MLKSILTPRTVLNLGSSVSIYEKIKDNASNQVMKTQNTEQSALNAKIIQIFSIYFYRSIRSPFKAQIKSRDFPCFLSFDFDQCEKTGSNAPCNHELTQEVALSSGIDSKFFSCLAPCQKCKITKQLMAPCSRSPGSVDNPTNKPGLAQCAALQRATCIQCVPCLVCLDSSWTRLCRYCGEPPP